MSDFDLLAVTLKDFRSVSGQVTIPLDAPIVLIHGVNGAGKSSVLSAIELGLTGSASGLTRGESGETRHLVHRGRQQAEVGLRSRLDGIDVETSVVVDADGVVTGEAALGVDDRRTFVERCYLAQSTVGRLLEIYQNKVNGESPLTRFVKDLLGLDRLEALIDGLYPAGDIRRLRNVVPELRGLETEEKRIERLHGIARQNLIDATAAMREATEQLARALAEATPNQGPHIYKMLPAELLAFEIPERGFYPSMELLEATRQELNGLRVRANSVPASEQTEITELEINARLAVEELEEWQLAVGQNLERLLDGLRNRFPNLPPVSNGPAVALKAALDEVRAEIERCSTMLNSDEAATRETALVAEQLSKARARVERFSAILSGGPNRVLDLARVLSEVARHLNGDVCPVCDRDYAKFSDEPLRDHLVKRVASLGSEGKRLQELVEALQEANADERVLVARLAPLERAQLTPTARLNCRRTVAELSEIERALRDLSTQVENGSSLARTARKTRTALFDARNAASRTAEIRLAISRTANALDAAPLGETEPIHLGVARLQTDVELRISWQKARMTEVSRLLNLREALSSSQSAELGLSENVARLADQLETCRHARAGFESRRVLARSLAGQAEAARNRVVRQVFNHSLNRIWRELFVRLVPSEPFVPAFKVTGEGGTVTAELETQHRDGGTGGNPSYMLSAGNLNTGAVTLFLALHLSVNARLPWLILDDPVQSMDEVHIAQFAALLRNLAKRGGKKIIIAVHERSLFDYLALELSPAFRGDKLITVELSRPDGGATQTNPEFITWQEDHALAMN